MPDYGFAVAKKLHNVTEADRYKIMTTKYPTLKLKASGEGILSTTTGGGGNVAEIAHNLGYKPRVVVYGKMIGVGETAVGSRFQLWNNYVYQGLQVADLYYYYADITKLYIAVDLSYLTDVNDYNFDYMYHIFYDEDELA